MLVPNSRLTYDEVGRVVIVVEPLGVVKDDQLWPLKIFPEVDEALSGVWVRHVIKVQRDTVNFISASYDNLLVAIKAEERAPVPEFLLKLLVLFGHIMELLKVSRGASVNPQWNKFDYLQIAACFQVDPALNVLRISQLVSSVIINHPKGDSETQISDVNSVIGAERIDDYLSIDVRVVLGKQNLTHLEPV